MTEQLRRIGYIRTSVTSPHPNTQADALAQAGCTELHEADGNADQRQALKDILDLLGDGDTLVVYRTGRLGRDEHTVANFKQQLKAAGIELAVSDSQQTEGRNHDA